MSRQRESCKATPKLTEDEEQWAKLTLDAALPILRGGLRSCMWYPCSGKGPRGIGEIGRYPQNIRKHTKNTH